MISDLASPTFASSEKIWTLSMSLRPASTPPLTPNVTIPPKPPFRYLHGLLVGRVRLEARVADPGDVVARLEPAGDRERVLAVALDPQRQGLEALEEQERVERAERGADVAQALDAELEDEREVAERGRVADAVVATGPGRRSPALNRGDAAQSNVPPSTTTPPIAVPWPPIHFVAEWMTMSAPCLIGWARSGANVLSTMTGTPRAWATSAIEARSWTSSRGLPISSRKTALVLLVDRAPERGRIGAVDEASS